jgi:hypothetical protein
VTQGARDSSGCVFGIPRFDPRADTLFEFGHDLGGYTAVNILTVRAGCFVFHFIFSFKNNFFLRETRDGLPGVQRRGPVKGAARPRSSQTLDGEHRWKTPSLKGAGEVGEKKVRKKNGFGQEHRRENLEVRGET